MGTALPGAKAMFLRDEVIARSALGLHTPAAFPRARVMAVTKLIDELILASGKSSAQFFATHEDFTPETDGTG